MKFDLRDQFPPLPILPKTGKVKFSRKGENSANARYRRSIWETIGRDTAGAYRDTEWAASIKSNCIPAIRRELSTGAN